MTQLSDLGVGFHLIPVREHDHVTTAPWRVSYSSPWERGTIAFEDAEAAKRYLRSQTAAWLRQDGYRLRLQAPRARRGLGRSHQYQECMTSWYDPMALQAVVILRGVLDDLRQLGND